jgi:hypothetical protein
MKITRHALARAVERHGIPGRRRLQRKHVDADVRYALERGLICPDGRGRAQRIHPDGRRWLIDTHDHTVVTSLPRMETRISSKPKEKK